MTGIEVRLTEEIKELLDESSAGLFPKVTEMVFNQIKGLHEEGIGAIIIEQDTNRSLNISDRGYVLAMGQNQFDDSADKILNNDQIRKAYLGG